MDDLDDFFPKNPSSLSLSANVQDIVQTLQRLEPHPLEVVAETYELKYLGLTLDVALSRICLPKDKLESLHSCAQGLQS